MPIIRVGARLVYFAHVPKCAGSAVEAYLRKRFGEIAFCDTKYLKQPAEKRWTRSSPQHVDREALSHLFPETFFDASFAVVRHPVARIVSAWHFQAEVEKAVPRTGVGFTDWLEDMAELWEERPFAYDNHTVPMDRIVPDGARIFHLEHGLDAIVPWLDEIAGDASGARSIGTTNRRSDRSEGPEVKVVPNKEDLDLIARLYRRDFDRFGYRPDQPGPLAPTPEGGGVQEPRRPGLAGLLGLGSRSRRSSRSS